MQLGQLNPHGHGQDRIKEALLRRGWHEVLAGAEPKQAHRRLIASADGAIGFVWLRGDPQCKILHSLPRAVTSAVINRWPSRPSASGSPLGLRRLWHKAELVTTLEDYYRAQRLDPWRHHPLSFKLPQGALTTRDRPRLSTSSMLTIRHHHVCGRSDHEMSSSSSGSPELVPFSDDRLGIQRAASLPCRSLSSPFLDTIREKHLGQRSRPQLTPRSSVARPPSAGRSTNLDACKADGSAPPRGRAADAKAAARSSAGRAIAASYSTLVQKGLSMKEGIDEGQGQWPSKGFVV